MTIDYWLIGLLALLAFVCRRHLAAILRWHPVIWLANILFIALVVGWIALALWLIKMWGAWGALLTLCLTGLCVVALRLCTGRWYWQDDDDVIDLD